MELAHPWRVEGRKGREGGVGREEEGETERKKKKK